jgi:phosphomannomutase
MPPKFGTSGLRGLVVELTPELVAAHVRAFLAACPVGAGVHVGRDLRPSSPAIAEEVLRAVTGAGVTATDCGALPTPALALAAMGRGQAAVMVTGSHIPADRNGLKFYLPTGEVSKADEAAILAALAAPAPEAAAPGPRQADGGATAAYVARYVAAFGPGALAGLRLGVYRHSTVARDALAAVAEGLGATVVPLAQSDTFIPVDTEAVEPEVRAALPVWAAEHGLDAILSADGDADRPLLADSQGRVIPGDLLGPITARHLGAATICTPVSSNTAVDAMGFAAVRRTRIGSPFVIAAMEAAMAEGAPRVVGYEANGGFLLGFAAELPGGRLAPLMTRDAVLPLIAPLAAARAAGTGLGALVAALPPRFTAADRLTGIEPEVSGPFLAALAGDAATRAAFLAGLAPETAADRTDGLRLTCGDEVVHLRPSGNAPEFRCYVEAGSPARAAELLALFLARLRARLG